MPEAAIATRDTFDSLFPKSERERFWGLVKDALEIFGAGSGLGETYRIKLDSAPPGERIAVYHTSPLHIAADLAGVAKIEEPSLTRYLALQRKAYGLPDGAPAARSASLGG